MEEQIKKRLEELAKQKEQVVAQLNAILGAEQELKSLLESGESQCLIQ
jgi:hypothetical protein